MFAARLITDPAVLDEAAPERKYVVETEQLELILTDWGAPGGEGEQLLFTLDEALDLARILNASTLLEERCEHCGAALETNGNPDMEEV